MTTCWSTAVPDHPDWGFDAEVTEDGRYLVITVWKGTDDKYRVLYKDLLEPYGIPLDLISTFDHEYSFVGNDGPLFFFKTDHQAPRKKLIAIDVRKPPAESQRVLIDEREETLTGVSLVGNLFVTKYLKDARTQIRIHTLAGTFIREVKFPGIGSASGFGGRQADTGDLLFLFQFCHASQHLPLRPDHRGKPLAEAGRRPIRTGRLRRQTGVLHQQRRHPGTDVHRPPPGCRAERRYPDAAVWIWGLQHLHAARVLDQPAAVDGNGRRLRHAQPARRRRVREKRGIAPAPNSRSRTSSTTLSQPPSG